MELVTPGRFAQPNGIVPSKTMYRWTFGGQGDTRE